MPSPQNYAELFVLAREEALFALALTKPAPERAAWLDRECAGDSALRARLEALLAAHAAEDKLAMGPEGQADTKPLSTVKAVGPHDQDETAGTTIGRYKLLERIGEGGMGLVYMAEQAEPVRRRVALKLIKLGMDTREVVGRFEAERQALAMMDHPCIARVLDGGATESGRPYFVMELVRGSPVTEFCERHRLSIRDRLELFIQICEAVQHAHQKGIIHRDLKPSNILVAESDGRPHPKIIDFGVAKAVAARLTEKTVFTQFHQVIGTPAYMSPEQAGSNREDVDTRSDIYSLGVLLYELLAGRTPFDTRKLLAEGYDAILRTVREQEPPKLSTRLSTLSLEEQGEVASRRQATPEKLSRLLRGELDWVVMKALEKERGRRYATAADFAGDLQRYLRREPVAAAPPSFTYRAHRFVARNRAAVAFSALVALLLLATTLLAIRSAVVEGRQRRELAVQRDFATNQAAFARAANEEAQRTLSELSETLSQLEVQKVSQLLDPSGGNDPDIGLAVAHLARSLRQNPSDFRAAYRLLSLLMQRDFARPLRERRFDGKILDMVWTERGLLVATTPTNSPSDGGPVTFFDFDSGQPVLGPVLEGANVSRLTFSPSGKRFWCAPGQGPSLRRQLLIGDVATGRPVGPAATVDGSVLRVVFDEAEERMIVQSQRRTSQGRIEVFEVLTGRPLGKPFEMTGFIYGELSFDAERRRVVVPGGGGGDSRLFDYEQGTVEELPRNRYSPFPMVASPQRANRRLWFGRSVVDVPGLWASSSIEAPFGGRQNASGIASLDGRRLAVLYEDSQTVSIWSLAPTHARPLPLPKPEGFTQPFSLASADMDPVGHRLVRFRGTDVAVWDLRQCRLLTTFTSSDGDIRRVRLSPDAELVLVISGGRARLRSASDGRSQGAEWGASTSGDWRLTDGLFSADGRQVLTWTSQGEGRAWRVDSLAPAGAFGPHGADDVTARLDSEGRRVVTYGRGNQARVWDLASGGEVCPPLQHAGEITVAEFVLDSEALVTGSKDGTAQVWNLTSGAALTPPLKHGAPVVRAVVLPQARRIATLGGDGGGRDVKLWDLRSGHLLQSIPPRSDPEAVLVGAAGGRLLLSLGYQTRVFDPATFVPLSEEMLIPTSVEAGLVSRDGGLLVTLGDAQAVVRTLPVVAGPAPSWLPELAEAIVTRRLTSQGVEETISFNEALRTLDRLRLVSGDDAFSRWARWYLADDADRTITPSVEVTQADLARLALASSDIDAIRSALELEPDNVVLLEAMAGALSSPLLPEQWRFQFGSEEVWIQSRLAQARHGLNVADHLLKRAPDSSAGWQLKAAAHAHLQETNRAADALNHLIDAPTSASQWQVRAYVLETVGRIDDADVAYSQAVASDRRSSGMQEGSILDARLAFLRRHGRQDAALREQLADRGIPPRDSATDERLLDLGLHYTGSLAKPFRNGYEGDDLAEVPEGVHTFATIPFDVRGVVETSNVEIEVRRKAQRLHFLQGAQSLWLGPTNERPVAAVVVHYADGQKLDFPVIGGRHVRDWFILPDEPVGASEAEVAWVGTNERSRLQFMRLRLFKMTWENPRPEVPIERLDVDMQNYGYGLFLLGITADDGSLPPATPEAPLLRAEIDEATGQFESALQPLESVLKDQPDNPRLVLLKARALAGLNRHSEAIDLLAPMVTRVDITNPTGLAERRSLLTLRSGWLKALGRDEEALADSLSARGIPTRDPTTPPALLDLSPFYNAALIGSWHSSRASNDLATLPVGVGTFGGVPFDIRGVVQLAGDPNLKGSFPLAQTNLVLNRTVRRLHALHATGWTEAPGKPIAALILRFKDGRQHEIRIVFGEDLRDWNLTYDSGNEPSRSKVAWRGRNGAGFDVRLFHSTWENPFPSVEVTAIDYISAGTQCAPFLIALTTE